MTIRVAKSESPPGALTCRHLQEFLKKGQPTSAFLANIT